ncbi:CMRF35-like molecule 6 isoform 2-T2 [Hipposideros larvatus]
MPLRVGAAWLPSVLLLLQVPGFWSLSGPHTVTGTVGGSLSVQCQYEEEFTGNVKSWCEYPCSLLMTKNIVETTKSEREVRRGRVSIRDDPANLTFTVTLDSLTEEDDGTYMCRINIPWGPDPTFLVKVSVFPVSTETPNPKIFTSSPHPLSSLLATTWPSTTRQVIAQQRTLPAPGLRGAAPVPEHAQCCPLGEQASEELWGEAGSA